MSDPGASTHRQRQAEATRLQILTAARALFVSPGYAGTSIAAIAERAGVGVSTVYAVFTSKPGVLEAIRARWPREPAVAELLREAETEPDAATAIEMVAHATRREWDADAETEAIDAGASAAAPETAGAWHALDAARRRARRAILAGLADRLADGLTVDSAAAIVEALCARELHAGLVAASGWSPERYEAWLATALARQLLA